MTTPLHPAPTGLKVPYGNLTVERQAKTRRVFAYIEQQYSRTRIGYRPKRSDRLPTSPTA